jgi:hypothetical protein
MAYSTCGTIQIVACHDGWFYVWQPLLPEDGALAPKHVAALCITLICEYYSALVGVINWLCWFVKLSNKLLCATEIVRPIITSIKVLDCIHNLRKLRWLSRNGEVNGLGHSSYDFWQKKEIFVFYKTSRPALWPTQPLLQWAPEFFLGCKAAETWGWPLIWTWKSTLPISFQGANSKKHFTLPDLTGWGAKSAMRASVLYLWFI